MREVRGNPSIGGPWLWDPPLPGKRLPDASFCYPPLLLQRPTFPLTPRDSFSSSCYPLAQAVSRKRRGPLEKSSKRAPATLLSHLLLQLLPPPAPAPASFPPLATLPDLLDSYLPSLLSVMVRAASSPPPAPSRGVFSEQMREPLNISERSLLQQQRRRRWAASRATGSSRGRRRGKRRRPHDRDTSSTQDGETEGRGGGERRGNRRRPHDG